MVACKSSIEGMIETSEMSLKREISMRLFEAAVFTCGQLAAFHAVLGQWNESDRYRQKSEELSGYLSVKPLKEWK